MGRLCLLAYARSPAGSTLCPMSIKASNTSEEFGSTRQAASVNIRVVRPSSVRSKVLLQ